VIDAQKSDIEKLEQSIGDARKAAQEQIAALEQQKQLVIQQPSQAPTIIREQIPFSTPIVQTAPIRKDAAGCASRATHEAERSRARAVRAHL
jgi:hypothetical protein